MDIIGSSIVCLMASKRRRKRGEPSNTLPIEESEDNVEDEESTGAEVLTELFSGGPTNITILPSFKTHSGGYLVWQCKILILRDEFFIVTC